MNDSHRVRFAHPAERVFAEILGFYGIRWGYEPSTFPLRRDKAGKVTLAFAPDFCLPDQDLCVELTTLRPHTALGYRPPATRSGSGVSTRCASDGQTGGELTQELAQLLGAGQPGQVLIEAEPKALSNRRTRIGNIIALMQTKMG